MPPFYEQIQSHNKGAWVIHHSQKTAGTINGAAEFSALDAAGKAAALLSQMAATSQASLDRSRVNALAKAASLSRIEVPELLRVLERRRLIDLSADGNVEVLGLTSRATVQHAAEIFEEQEPSPEERASIVLAEVTSAAPVPQQELVEFVSDEFRLGTSQCRELLVRSETVGFVDAEGQGTDKLYFNGNLFRRDNLVKISRVLHSLTGDEQAKVAESTKSSAAADALMLAPSRRSSGSRSSRSYARQECMTSTTSPTPRASTGLSLGQPLSTNSMTHSLTTRLTSPRPWSPRCPMA